MFEDLGEKPLKNITRPVRVYRVLPGPDGQAEGRPATDGGAKRGAVVKPSIAVLPFANMSGDAEQEFFADGLTEDILTELSRRRELFVISRTRPSLQGQAVNMREGAQKLRRALSGRGSVRKAGDRMRITVQLIDTATDVHIWAERYDRKPTNLRVQDEITSAIVATLPGRLEAAQHDQITRLKPASMAAYSARWRPRCCIKKLARGQCRGPEMIDRALALDPTMRTPCLARLNPGPGLGLRLGEGQGRHLQ